MLSHAANQDLPVIDFPVPNPILSAIPRSSGVNTPVWQREKRCVAELDEDADADADGEYEEESTSVTVSVDVDEEMDDGGKGHDMVDHEAAETLVLLSAVDANLAREAKRKRSE